MHSLLHLTMNAFIIKPRTHHMNSVCSTEVYNKSNPLIQGEFLATISAIILLINVTYLLISAFSNLTNAKEKVYIVII
jgi:hypothetical protein